MRRRFYALGNTLAYFGMFRGCPSFLARRSPAAAGGRLEQTKGRKSDFTFRDIGSTSRERFTVPSQVGLLMLGGRPKLCRLCLDNTNISNGGTKPYELQLAPHACPGNDVLFMCSRTCWGEDPNHLRRALGRRDCSSNRPSDPNHGQVRLRPDICR